MKTNLIVFTSDIVGPDKRVLDLQLLTEEAAVIPKSL